MSTRIYHLRPLLYKPRTFAVQEDIGPETFAVRGYVRDQAQTTHYLSSYYLAELLNVVEEGVETAEAGAEDHEAPQEAGDGDLGEHLGQGLGAGLPGNSQ